MKSQVEQTLLHTLSDGKPRTVGELRVETGISISQARRVLTHLQDSGIVCASAVQKGHAKPYLRYTLGRQSDMPLQVTHEETANVFKPFRHPQDVALFGDYHAKN